MKLIKTLLVAGLLTSGVAACADYSYGPDGGGYDYRHNRPIDHNSYYWKDGRRYCRSAVDPDDFRPCNPN